jgi:hypothetical protein
LPNGLYYTISGAFSSVTAGTAPTAAGGLSGSDADTYTFTVNGAMPAQAGTDTAGSQSQTRTVTLNY